MIIKEPIISFKVLAGHVCLHAGITIALLLYFYLP
jgi:accessory gene regulator protein AgrB